MGHFRIVRENGLDRPSATSRTSDLAEFELALQRVPGVTGARVVGQDSPTEVHVVADAVRTPKQIVRDVQSLAAANFGMKIDHRIVSVVRLEAPTDPPDAGHRPYIEKIGIGSRSNMHWVEVSLRWPDGSSTDGSGAGGTSRETRARGAATAVVECLDGALRERKTNAEVDHVEIHRIAGSEWILVHATMYEGRSSTPLLGAAQLNDDTSTAAAKATLDAINRRLFR
jgi:hypothetical protein